MGCTPSHEKNKTVLDSSTTINIKPVLKNVKAYEKKPAQQRLYKFIYDNVIGKDAVFDGPYGKKKVVYCDYTASGRPLRYIEDFINQNVYELYANTHTTANITGRTTQQLREEARQIVRKCVNASDEDVVIFTGNGVTGAVHKLIGCLNIEQGEKKTVVLVGPYEHHSNILPWKEVGAKVVRIQETKKGGLIDKTDLEAQLLVYSGEDYNIIVSFSAASNITGIITDTNEISRMVHEYGGHVFWDYATAGPYLEMDMNPSPTQYKDAIFLSPHKFVGGPGTPGILIAKKKLFQNDVPHGCGGGTVVYVTRENHRYINNIEEREEGGTPAIVEAIRAGLVFQLKMNTDSISLQKREHDLCARALKVWKQNKNIVVLGSLNAERIPIFSITIRHPESNTLLHYNFVAAVLNDLFGIQSRGGCACAGPYASDLLGIPEPTAEKFFHFLTTPEERQKEMDSKDMGEEIQQKMDIMKPGFTRLNLPYFVDDDVIDYIIEAVGMVARYGWMLLPQYTFNCITGAWSHKEASMNGPLSLSELATDIKKRHAQPRRKLTGAVSITEMKNKAEKVFNNAKSDAKLYTWDDSDVFHVVPRSHHEFVWFTTPNDARKAMSETISVSKAGNRQPFKPRPQTAAPSRTRRHSTVSTSLEATSTVSLLES